jgi:hypothetical protein
MLPYDPRRNYFGAEGSKLADVFAEILKLMPALRGGFNYAAYRHDVAYSGTKKKGFFARIKNFFARKKADKKFRDDLEAAIAFTEDEGNITTEQADRAMVLKKLSYKAVRYLGWKSYRTGDAND